MIHRPDAVVFDCDGVLVDSEPHSVAAWVSVLDGLGHPAGEADVAACTGLGFHQTWEAIDAVAALPEPASVWRLLIGALALRFVDPGLDRFPDAVAVLERCLSAGMPVAVVSASPRERLDLTLRHAGLAGVVPVTISGSDVARGKPAPDPYLAAASGLGIGPALCVAVEDSPAGAESALAAGMRVVGVVRSERLRAALTASGADVVDRLTPEALGL